MLAGTTLFDAASWNGVAIDSTCGGHGTCKKCKVRVVSGNVPISAVDPRAFSTEELRSGWRLACRAPAQEDVTIEVPPLQTRPKAALAGVGRHVILRPAVQKRYLELEEPTLEDQRSDLERVLAGMDDVELRVPLEVVRSLGGTLRQADWKVTAVIVDDVLTDVEPGDTTGSRHALAFDLGTTTVVATLLDLETGQPKAVRSILNAQQSFGADVISRISATMLDTGALDLLRTRAHETLRAARGGGLRGGRRGAARRLRGRRHRQRDDDPDRTRHRSRAALDGAVHDRRPHAAAGDRSRLRHPRARTCAGGAVPGARRLCRPGHRRRHPRDRPYARPPRAALHRRRHQLRDRARLVGAGACVRGARRACVRGGADPLRDARVGRRDRGCEDPRRRSRADRDRRRGAGRVVRLRSRRRRRRARRRRNPRPLGPLRARGLAAASARSARRTSSTSSDDVFLSQRDVRELQFAKASISTGWSILCLDLGIEPEEIAQVLLGGSFGSYLTPASAMRIGLVPTLPLTRIVAAGNVAGEGAKIAALSITERAAAAAVLDEVELRRALGPPRLQRPVHRPTRVSRMTTVVVSCGALAVHVKQIASPSRLGRRGAAGAAGAAQPAGAHPRRGRGGRRRRRASSSPTPHCGADLDGLRAPRRRALLRGLRRGRTSPARISSPTSSSAASTASSSGGSGSTATRSSATTTSATTRGSSGSRSGRPPSSGRRPSAPRRRSGCRSRCACHGRRGPGGRARTLLDRQEARVLINKMPRYEILSDERAVGHAGPGLAPDRLRARDRVPARRSARRLPHRPGRTSRTRT